MTQSYTASMFVIVNSTQWRLFTLFYFNLSFLFLDFLEHCATNCFFSPATKNFPLEGIAHVSHPLQPLIIPPFLLLPLCYPCTFFIKTSKQQTSSGRGRGRLFRKLWAYDSSALLRVTHHSKVQNPTMSISVSLFKKMVWLFAWIIIMDTWKTSQSMSNLWLK